MMKVRPDIGDVHLFDRCNRTTHDVAMQSHSLVDPHVHGSKVTCGQNGRAELSCFTTSRLSEASVLDPRGGFPQFIFLRKVIKNTSSLVFIIILF